MNKEYFLIEAKKYDPEKSFNIVRPASINKPKDNAVMFITKKFIAKADVFNDVKECLIYWPEDIDVPAGISEKNAIVKCGNPHTEYCRFFSDNKIEYIPEKEKMDLVDGAFISPKAVIGKDPVILPGAYIGGECRIGDNVYIGSGARLVGDITIGDNVVIRENTVIGVDSLSIDRNSDGSALTMPQFGSVVIEDDVKIGANVVIARGAIDETHISKGVKISHLCFIAHNVYIGENTFIVAGANIIGSARIGKNCLISAEALITNYTEVGDNCVIGLGSLVNKSIPENSVAYGTPAKVVRGR